MGQREGAHDVTGSYQGGSISTDDEIAHDITPAAADARLAPYDEQESVKASCRVRSDYLRVRNLVGSALIPSRQCGQAEQNKGAIVSERLRIKPYPERWWVCSVHRWGPLV